MEGSANKSQPKGRDWGHWARLKEDLRERFARPLEHPAFIIYFIVVVLIVGGTGVAPAIEAWWYASPLDSSRQLLALSVALANYSVAVLAPAPVDLFVGDKPSRSIQMIGIASVMLILIAVSGVRSLQNAGIAIAIALFATIYSLAFWWFANPYNTTLTEPTPPPGAATGGSTNAIQGTTDGYRV